MSEQDKCPECGEPLSIGSNCTFLCGTHISTNGCMQEGRNCLRRQLAAREEENRKLRDRNAVLERIQAMPESELRQVLEVAEHNLNAMAESSADFARRLAARDAEIAGLKRENIVLARAINERHAEIERLRNQHKVISACLVRLAASLTEMLPLAKEAVAMHELEDAAKEKPNAT